MPFAGAVQSHVGAEGGTQDGNLAPAADGEAAPLTGGLQPRLVSLEGAVGDVDRAVGEVSAAPSALGRPRRVAGEGRPADEDLPRLDEEAAAEAVTA